MKNTGKFLAVLLCAALCLSLAACGGKESGGSTHTAQEYADAICAARSEEENQYQEVLACDKGGAPFYAHNPNNLGAEDAASMAPFVLEALGLSDETVDTYAVSVSMMNVRAYFVGIVVPAEGKGDDVKAGLENYLKLQQQSFEMYLEDQYEVAKNAVIEQLPGGAYLVVMAENGAEMLEKIKEAL